MTQWIKRQLATPFMKSMAVLFSGTALANIIMLVMTPILMLLYTPAEFGILSVFTAILMLIIMFFITFFLSCSKITFEKSKCSLTKLFNVTLSLVLKSFFVIKSNIKTEVLKHFAKTG